MPLITEIIQVSCRNFAQKPAFRVKSAGKWIGHTYQQLWDDAAGICGALQDWGLQAGDRCAVLGPSSPYWVKSYLGILLSGGICVPIDKDLKQGELRHILADCQARILFTEQSYLEKLSDISADLPDLEQIIIINQAEKTNGLAPEAEASLAALLSEWRDLAEKYQISPEEVSHIEGIAEGVHGLLQPNTLESNGAQDGFLARLLRRNSEGEHLGPLPVEQFMVAVETINTPRSADDTAVILYTSGTTGRSKGAMLSHNNIVSNIQGATELFDLDQSMTTLSFLPINHVFEQVCGILLPLSVGGTVNFAESLKKIGDNLGEVKPNFLLGVPAVFRLLHDRLYKKVMSKPVSRALFNFSPTRRLVTKKIAQALGGQPIFVSGGAALDPTVSKGLSELGVRIFQGYGITETSPVIAAESPRLQKLGTVGLPMKGIQVKINNPGPEGTGEIWVKGPNVMQGYFNNPQATAEVLSDGWYHTGDLGRLDEDGILSICGRLKNLIVTANGKNVYPEEIENELLNSPFIEEVMVYGHEVSPTVEEVHAMIYPCQEALDSYEAEQGLKAMSMKDVEDLIRADILAFGKNLADYKRVRRFTLREDEFPKTTTRKIKRFAVEAKVETDDQK